MSPLLARDASTLFILIKSSSNNSIPPLLGVKMCLLLVVYIPLSPLMPLSLFCLSLASDHAITMNYTNLQIEFLLA